MSAERFEFLVRPGQRVLWQQEVTGAESLYLLGPNDIAELKTLFFSGPATEVEIAEAAARAAAEKAATTGVPVVFSF